MRQGYRNYSVFGYRPVQASGGSTLDILVDGRPYRVHVFLNTGSSNFVVHNAGTDPTAEYLIIGGGGAGAQRHGGGGGAGGVVGGSLSISAQSYNVSVGAGGPALAQTVLPSIGTPTNGQSSSIFGITALGGGAGGSGSGGSGGGGTAGAGASGGSGTAGQGNSGGSGSMGPFSNESSYAGGGGGGAGSAGSNATSSTPAMAGNGGDAITSSITGNLQFYAAGGGGGVASTGTAGPSGQGGSGGWGGGNGGRNFGAGSGAANTGSGGGGGGFSGSTNFPSGRGGSGVVIVRYPTGPSVPLPYMTATGGTERIYQDLLSQRINLATDPSFELTTGGWEPSNSGSSVQRTTAKYYSGTSSVRVYQRFFGNSIGAGTLVSCVAGRTYSISFKLWLEVGRSITVRSDATNANYGPFIPISGTDNWQTVTINNIYATGNQVGVIFFSNDTLLTEAFIDELIVEESSTVGTYFDGSSPGCSWSGTPNASTSISNQIATYKSHTFTATGSSTFQVTELGVAPYGSEIQYMLVGGGGSGQTAGGGAGGMIVSSATVSVGTYDISVGAGGLSNYAGTPSNGNQTTLTGSGINKTTAFGGGLGGTNYGGSQSGSYGGSGGGAATNGDTNVAGVGGLGVSGQGNSGGLSAGNFFTAGGGGGAGSVGQNAPDSFIGGAGGSGLLNTYRNGTTQHYAGGGAGLSQEYIAPSIGGGGGTSGAPAYNGMSGTANTGGGGGAGGDFSGGGGGSGIVVIRYRIA